MELREALALPMRGSLSLVGGGGKSTLLLRLAQELSRTGRVAALTTTHISRAQGEAVGRLLTEGGAAELERAFAESPAVCVASPAEGGKLGPPGGELLRAARDLADWVLAEADGARRLPVKAPAGHEPVLLEGGLVAAVAGLSALGRPLEEICHRPELAAEVLEVGRGAALTPRLLARLLTSERGQFKGVGEAHRFRVVLNQADDGAALALGRETAVEVQSLLPGCRVVVAALGAAECVKEVF